MGTKKNVLQFVVWSCISMPPLLGQAGGGEAENATPVGVAEVVVDVSASGSSALFCTSNSGGSIPGAWNGPLEIYIVYKANAAINLTVAVGGLEVVTALPSSPIWDAIAIPVGAQGSNSVTIAADGPWFWDSWAVCELSQGCYGCYAGFSDAEGKLKGDVVPLSGAPSIDTSCPWATRPYLTPGGLPIAGSVGILGTASPASSTSTGGSLGLSKSGPSVGVSVARGVSDGKTARIIRFDNLVIEGESGVCAKAFCLGSCIGSPCSVEISGTMIINHGPREAETIDIVDGIGRQTRDVGEGPFFIYADAYAGCGSPDETASVSAEPVGGCPQGVRPLPLLSQEVHCSSCT